MVLRIFISLIKKHRWYDTGNIPTNKGDFKNLSKKRLEALYRSVNSQHCKWCTRETLRNEASCNKNLEFHVSGWGWLRRQDGTVHLNIGSWLIFFDSGTIITKNKLAGVAVVMYELERMACTKVSNKSEANEQKYIKSDENYVFSLLRDVVKLSSGKFQFSISLIYLL